MQPIKMADTIYTFPAKRPDGIFQIGVAIGESPAGPFIPEPEPIKNSYSIDPAVFPDDDGKYYMYFGGIWGGQLQSYRNNIYQCRIIKNPYHMKRPLVQGLPCSRMI